MLAEVPSDVTSSPVVSVFGPAWPRAQLISVSPSRKRLDDDATPVEYADPRRATRQATSSFPASLVQHCCRRVKPKNGWMRKFFLRVQAGSVSAASNSGTDLTHLGSPHGTPGSHGESPASCPPSRLDKEVAVGSRVWGLPLSNRWPRAPLWLMSGTMSDHATHRLSRAGCPDEGAGETRWALGDAMQIPGPTHTRPRVTSYSPSVASGARHWSHRVSFGEQSWRDGTPKLTERRRLTLLRPRCARL